MHMHNPPHPGAVLKEWLVGITLVETARRLGVSRQTLSAIINGRAAVTADMDLRLADALGTSPGFWAGMQLDYDLWRAKHRARPRIKRFPHLARAA